METKLRPSVHVSIHLGEGYDINPIVKDYSTGREPLFYSVQIGTVSIDVSASVWEEFKDKLKAALEHPI